MQSLSDLLLILCENNTAHSETSQKKCGDLYRNGFNRNGLSDRTNDIKVLTKDTDIIHPKRMQVLLLRSATRQIPKQCRGFAKINRVLFSHPGDQPAPLPQKQAESNIVNIARPKDLSKKPEPEPILSNQFFDIRIVTDKTGMAEKQAEELYVQCSRDTQKTIELVREVHALKLATQTGYDVEDCRDLLEHCGENYRQARKEIDRIEAHPYNHSPGDTQKDTILKHLKSWKDIFYGGG